MKFSTPELRSLGSLASLTLGQNGSCPDGLGNNNNSQLGGGASGGSGKGDGCGRNDNNGSTN